MRTLPFGLQTPWTSNVCTRDDFIRINRRIIPTPDRNGHDMTVTLREMFFLTAIVFAISMQVCWGKDVRKSSYGPSPSTNDNYQNSYESEIQRPLAVFTEKPVNVANLVLIPVIQVPSSDLKIIYKPQIDSVSKTEPIIMCKSSTKSFEATPAVLVPLAQPFYLYDERTMIPFPKTVTILHGGYRMSIPVGVVVAPIPVGVLRAGPVLVTTLYAIPASPVLVPSTIRFVPVQPSPPQYSYPAPPSPPKNSNPSPPSMSSSQWSYPAASPPPKNANPAPPAMSSSQWSYPSPPKYSNPSPPPKYSYPSPPSPPAYSYPSPPPKYSYPSPPPKYSMPTPPEPTYYQHAGDYGGDDLRYPVDPPGKLYSHYSAESLPPPPPQPFYNSKESPLLQQLRDESAAEKNRNKYVVPMTPAYAIQYPVIVDAY